MTVPAVKVSPAVVVPMISEMEVMGQAAVKAETALVTLPL